MNTLVELIPELQRLGMREAVIHTNGYRTRRWSYRDLYRHVAGTAERLDALRLSRGDRVLLWSENRPEWLAVFWAAVARGITVVPIDVHSSPDFVSRVQADVRAKLLVHGPTATPLPELLPTVAIESLVNAESDAPVTLADADVDDIVQVLYTSGTTGTPSGVVHRHRNLVSNLAPIKKEIDKYAWLAWPFQPVRILGLLPASHVFGQFTTVFVPIVLGGAAVFMDEIHPSAVVNTIARERVSVLSTVPRALTNLRLELDSTHAVDTTAETGRGISGIIVRFWKHRAIHRRLGWKFWAVLSGGARLPDDDEAFFWHVGIALIQGYGLTETSSVVATNHPFHPKRGALGQALGSQEVKLAEDGEILVRGDNVSQDVFGEAPKPRDLWLHTGDIGELGADGVLYYRGRKKDVIVGADGLNVHPTDVEAALHREPEIEEAVVVARTTQSSETVHAVLLLSSSVARGDTRSIDQAIARANETLEPHQRVKDWSLWRESDFPRTSGTLKIRRHAVQARLGAPSTPAGPPRDARGLVAEHLGKSRETLSGQARLSEELGLTSLDRIELLTRLEGELGKELSETEMSNVATLDELESILERGAQATPDESSALNGIVRYARALPVRGFRWLFRETVIRPLFRHYIPLAIRGSLDGVTAPVIFAANHQSNLDTLAMLTALPRRFRGRLAPAIHQGYFDPYLKGSGLSRERLSFAAQFWLAVGLTGAFPIARDSAASRRSLRFAGELVDQGHSILIFPEGRLTRDGAIDSFKPGVGILATRLQVPVIPVHIQGLYEVMSHRDRWPRPAPVRLGLGRPLRFSESESPVDVARRVESEVRALGEPDRAD